MFQIQVAKTKTEINFEIRQLFEEHASPSHHRSPLTVRSTGGLLNISICCISCSKLISDKELELDVLPLNGVCPALSGDPAYE